MTSVGIEIGGTKLQIAEGDAEGCIINEIYRFNVARERGAAGILDQIEATLKGLPEKPAHIGIGFGGPVHRLKGKVATSHQIGGWSGFELVKWLRERFDAAVYLENDANAAALGEALHGAGKGFAHVFYVTLGSGVGGGMVVNGKLYHGNEPGEAELGLMKMDRAQNTLESYCSGWALDQKIRKVVPSLPAASVLKQLAGSAAVAEAKFLLPALEQEDVYAHEILNDYADTLAWGLSHVVHLFNPQVIVIGGGVSLIGEPLRRAVEKSIMPYLVKAYQPGPVIRLSELKERVVPVGALSLIQSNQRSPL